MLASGTSKIIWPFYYLMSVLSYSILLPPLVMRVAVYLLPCVELVSALFLISLRTRAMGMSIAACLLVCFTVIQTRVVLAGMYVECGCFGPYLSGSVGANTLGRNAFLLALCVAWFVCRIGATHERRRARRPSV